MRQVWPLSQNGASAEMSCVLGAAAGVTVEDRTPLPRFGLKGAGAVEWFTEQGLALPPVNRTGFQQEMRLLRLGPRDVMAVTESGTAAAVSDLAERWRAAPSGYSSWREEAWAWLRMTGPQVDGVMARLTAFDLRQATFAADHIAQTRAAHLDMVIVRVECGFDLFFDIAATAQVLHDIEITRSAMEDAHA